jgi:hypothetical protein
LEVTRTTLDRAYAPELWRLKGELLEAQARVEGSVPKARRARVGGSRPHAAEQALACFQRALGLTRAAQAKSLELRAATSLARARHVRGRTADARRLLGDVVEWFGTRATSPDLVEARVLLEGLDKS